MGHPKKQRRKYESPFKPFDKNRIESEKKLLVNYGLRRKHEIRRAEDILRNFRRRARELQARPDEKMQKELLEKLNKLGIRCEKLEDILGITLDHVLSRRLQTIVYKKFSKKPKLARQLITHGHIRVAGRKVSWPSYMVPLELENKIVLNAKLVKAEIAKEAKEIKHEQTESKEGK